MAGVAGALYVPQVGIINPSEFSPANSIEVVIWVAVGGRGTLTGAVVGAVLVNYAKTTFTAGTQLPYWMFGTAVLLTFVSVVAIQKAPGDPGHALGLAVAAIATPFVPAFVPNSALSLAGIGFARCDGQQLARSAAGRGPRGAPVRILYYTATDRCTRALLAICSRECSSPVHPPVAARHCRHAAAIGNRLAFAPDGKRGANRRT